MSMTEYYTSRGSPVYLDFLDASKASDRVNYWKFSKLSGYNVRLSKYWYTKQEFSVK